jgi:CRP-like cAMP-binding protein
MPATHPPIEPASDLPIRDRHTRERNLLVESLPSRDRALLESKGERVPLPVGMSIYEASVPITHVYFPMRGIVSMVSAMREGTVEIGTMGREGMTGIALLLDADSMPTRAFVQVEGAALCISADALRNVMRASAALERTLRRYSLVLFNQVAQGAACNRLHTLEARCARWLLMTHDRHTSDVLPLKQSFLAEMLGVHRPAVTVAAGALQDAGIIRYSRGKVTIIDRSALEHAACDCYQMTLRDFGNLRTL